ncbi:MAG TPA: ANTAR domain-containing protein [Rhodopila sp.]|nr:ANTAR domain-containing protein [Rhodopila sp.]
MNVLLADDDAERAGPVARVLAIDPGLTELRLKPGESLAEALAKHAPDVKQILRAALALFRRHRQDRDDLKEAEGRLQERAVIDKAKAILIGPRRLSEPEAYPWLRRTAMSSARRIVDVARALIRSVKGNA